MAYSRDYFIHYYQIDLNLNLSVVGLLRILEDIAILHSDDMGLGLKYYEENNLGWMLIRWHIKINRMPKFKDTVTVITEPKAFRNFYANRFYTVNDREGNVLVDAKTLWAFVNTGTRKPMKVNDDMYKGFQITEEDNIEFTKLEIVPAISRIDESKSFNVRISDIDTNQHVNNTQYVAWAIEAVPLEVQTQTTLKEITVNYLKETNLGNVVQSNVEITDIHESTECLHSLKSNDVEVCRVKSVWNKL